MVIVLQLPQDNFSGATKTIEEFVAKIQCYTCIIVLCSAILIIYVEYFSFICMG